MLKFQMKSSSVNSSNTLQAFWVGIGSLATFGFTLISSAILSRYLCKAEYGTYKQVMYLYNTLLFVFTLGLPKAYSYFLAKNDIKYGKNIVEKINRAFIIMGLLFSICLFVGAPMFAKILNNDNLVIPLRVFSLTPAALLPTMGIDSIMAVYKKTLYSAIYVIFTRCLMLICVILPILLFRSDVNLAIAGFTFSSMLSLVIALYIKKIPYKDIVSEKTSLSLKEIFRFSFPLMIASIGGIAIKSADQFFVSRYFGSEVFADFANGSLELPIVGMVLSAGATVLLPVFSKYVSSKDVELNEIIDLWQRSMLKSATIIYPVIVFCSVFASDIMIVLYGKQYETSAIYFQIMSIVNIFTVAQYYPLIISLGETKYYARVHLCLAVVVWILEFIIVQVIPDPIYITISSVLCHLLKIYIMSRFIAKSLLTSILNLFPVVKMIKVFIPCVLSAFLVLLIEYNVEINNIFLKLSFSFVFFATFLCAIGNFFKVNYIDVLLLLLKKQKNEN